MNQHLYLAIGVAVILNTLAVLWQSRAVERRLGARIDGVNTRIDSLEKVMNARFAIVDARFAAIHARFDLVNEKFETRLARLRGHKVLKIEIEYPRAVSVAFETERFVVELSDGRAIAVPYAYSPRLLNATAEQRADYKLIGRGDGISWPQIDEDLSVAGLLRG